MSTKAATAPGIALGIAQRRGVAQQITGGAVLEPDLLLEVAYLFAASGALDRQFFRGQDPALNEHLEVPGALILGR
jgi:hypothetical protein